MLRRSLAALIPALLLPLLCGCGGLQPSQPTVRVLCWNIHHGRGMDGEVDIQRIADLIEDSGADLVALQEVDCGVRRSEHCDMPALLAELTGMTPVFGKNIDYQGGGFGNVVLSRWPVLQSDNHLFEMRRDGEQRGLLRVTVDGPRGPLNFWVTHLDGRVDGSERLLHVNEILSRLPEFGYPPTILCGDFNARPDSLIHQLLLERMHDAWIEAGQGDGHTFMADAPDRRIDWILPARIAGLTALHAEVLPSQASDHLPLRAVIQIED